MRKKSFHHPVVNLATKILVACGLCFIIIQVVAVSISGFMMKKEVEKRVYSQAIQKSQILGQKIARSIAEQSVVMRSIQSTIESGHKTGILTKQFIVDLLLEDMQRFPAIFGMDFKEVPRGFDGTQIPGGPGTNPEGIFFPYVVRDDRGSIVIRTPSAHYSDFYKTIISTGKPDGLEPYIDHDTGVPMVSPTFPITFDGRRIAVVGADIPLGWLVPMLQDVQIAPGTKISLLSSQGYWVVSPTPALLMQHFRDDSARSFGKAFTSHRITVIPGFNGGSADRILVPLKVDGFNTYWTLVVDLPAEAIAAPVRNTIFWLVIPGIVLIAVSLLLMWVIFHKLLSKPLTGLIASVSALEEGKYQNHVFGTRRQDEIGAIARGLDAFRASLLKAQEADILIAQERRLNEQSQQSRHEQDERRLEDIRKVIEQIGGALAALSSGDLASELSQPLPEEFEVLRADFNRSISELAETIKGISEAAQTIRAGSDVVHGGAENLAQRTEQQAAALEQTTAAISQIARSASHSEELITSAQTIGVDACKSAEASSDIMRRTRDAMQRIETSSAQIVDIVSIIENIAFQTNVLALNASIEAARAGDAGRGFAVVAEEVRTLAQRCAEAAKNVSELVGKTTDEIRSGAECVHETECALARITALVTTMGEKLTTIVRNAREQAVSLKEVDSALGVMDQTTQQNAGIADDARTASRSLSQETHSMLHLILRFSLPMKSRAVL
ncbi:methyl-accepting chemotaxis protein [Asaia sp. VD9]|uniref:methyl-accepting chemotaxis protein n=1 Tax=Asaia sp. VD9 TaxID=3081235 RepID=UPI00301B4C6B